MKQAGLATLMLAMLVLSTRLLSAQMAGVESDPEADVRAAISEFGRAFVAADGAALRALLTENYVHVNGRSGNVLTRDEWLAWITSRRALLDRGELVINSYDISDVNVTIHGEAAVVTGIVRSSGTRKGTAFTSQVRFTNLWVQEEGVWRRAAFHDSPLPEAGG